MSNTPAIEAILFTLMGGGDKMLFLAPRQALEWCENVEPGSQALPEDIRQAIGPFLDDDKDTVQERLREEIYVTSGSADNDAALYLSGVCRNFDTAKQAIAHASAQGWAMSDDEYDGYIY